MGLRLLFHSTHTSAGLAHRFVQGAVTIPNVPLYFTKSPTFTDSLQVSHGIAGLDTRVPAHNFTLISAGDLAQDDPDIAPLVAACWVNISHQITDFH